ncbi:MAG: hypothetical protein ACNS62_07300 [Candidatus Cyclobacteriaceae bacterium M3_2C_046]
MIFSKLGLSLLGTFIGFSLIAQVSNDDIENRKFLELNQEVSSRTDDCSVQWQCVDETLTGKCIEYHNDQWFSFNSGKYRKLYINIMNQECRDLRGVQLVVIKGKPCEISSYQVLTCVSLANQNDIYVELDSLDSAQNYLVNIDGYLHDHCAFQLEVSATAKGLPVDRSLSLPAKLSQTDKKIRIDWVLPDSLDFLIQEFQLFRRTKNAPKNELVGLVPVTSNAFGTFKRDYYYEDSIKAENTYIYQLAAKNNQDKLELIDTYKFHVNQDQEWSKFKTEIIIPIGQQMKKKSRVSIIISDYYSGKIITTKHFLQKRNDPSIITFPTINLARKGIRKLEVEVIKKKGRPKRKQFVYNLEK